MLSTYHTIARAVYHISRAVRVKHRSHHVSRSVRVKHRSHHVSRAVRVKHRSHHVSRAVRVKHRSHHVSRAVRVKHRSHHVSRAVRVKRGCPNPNPAYGTSVPTPIQPMVRDGLAGYRNAYVKIGPHYSMACSSGIHNPAYGKGVP